MKVKMKFCILAMLVLTVAAVWFETGEAGAFTISDDGEYALVLKLKVSDADATIDGQQSGKVIKFNFDEDEEAIRVSDLTQGICPYNGKNEFSGWAGDSASSETVEMLSKDEFSSTGSMYEWCVLYKRPQHLCLISGGRNRTTTAILCAI